MRVHGNGTYEARVANRSRLHTHHMNDLFGAYNFLAIEASTCTRPTEGLVTSATRPPSYQQLQIAQRGVAAMSKLSAETLREGIGAILTASQEKQRKFYRDHRTSGEVASNWSEMRVNS